MATDKAVLKAIKGKVIRANPSHIEALRIAGVRVEDYVRTLHTARDLQTALHHETQYPNYQARAEGNRQMIDMLGLRAPVRREESTSESRLQIHIAVTPQNVSQSGADKADNIIDVSVSPRKD